MRDSWWESLTPALEKITVPMLVCASFSDANLHSIRSFRAFRKVGSADRFAYLHRGPKWSTFYGEEAKAALTTPCSQLFTCASDDVPDRDSASQCSGAHPPAGGRVDPWGDDLDWFELRHVRGRSVHGDPETLEGLADDVAVEGVRLILGLPDLHDGVTRLRGVSDVNQKTFGVVRPNDVSHLLVQRVVSLDGVLDSHGVAVHFLPSVRIDHNSNGHHLSAQAPSSCPPDTQVLAPSG